MFYVLAALIVLAALAAVLAPSTRQVLVAVAATDVLVGVLLIAGGAYLLGVIAVAAPAACVLGGAVILRRTGYARLLVDASGPAAGWPVAAAVAVAAGAVLLWTATRVEDRAGSSPPGQSLLSVLHLQAPVSVAAIAVLAVLAVAGALLVGRTGEDERLADRALEQRRMREERTRIRRQQRDEARSRRSAGGQVR